MLVDKPWGYELIFAHTNKYVGKILYIYKNKRLSKQFHKVKDETIFISKGLAKIEINDEIFFASKGEYFHVRPNVIHRFSAMDEDVEIFEVSTPELMDVVRLEDDFSREGS